MITIITGKPGVGKTALNTYFCWQTYRNDSARLLKLIRDRIELINESRITPLTAPTDPPIYTNYEVKFLIGYEKHYEPYYINPYYLGLSNDKMKMQNIPPYSRLFISEAQRYYNSRKSSTLPDWVSRFYEMHRHYGIDIYLDVQRGKLIDLNIRELCKRFIEVQGITVERSGGTWIDKTRWECREFTSMQDYDDYVNGDGANYIETVYEYAGDIFASYNSTSCFNEFVPIEGEDFHYLPYRQEGSHNPDDPAATFYNTTEPELYRQPDKAAPKPVKEKK